jgi:DNA polymerase-1
MSKKLYLLDAMALAYRAHFIFISRPLINARGENTSATYGFASALIKLIEDHQIEHMAVVFDVMGEGGTFRDAMYEDYKAHRDPPPEDLLLNLPWIKEMVMAMDIPVLEQDGFEADDIIGTLAVKAAAGGDDVVIVSPDKDFQQLLSPRISQFRPAYRGEAFDLNTDATFREKYGLEPIQFIDVLALMGDAADNVPGVPGIGEKTALKLIAAYESVENLLEHAGEIKGKKAREGLEQHAKEALLSKALVTIHTEMEIPLDWDMLHRKSPDLSALRSVLERLEFPSLYRRLERVLVSSQGGSSPAKTEPAPRADGRQPVDAGDARDAAGDLFGGTAAGATPYRTIEDVSVDYRGLSSRAEVASLCETLLSTAEWAFDSETTSTDAMLASPVGLSFSWAPHQGVYVPLPLPDGTSTPAVLSILQPAFSSAALKVGQNVKYDLLVLAQAGLSVEGPFFDTMVAHYLVDPDGRHGMDEMARNMLDYEPISIKSLIGSGRQQRSMRDVPIADVIPYACEDADITLQLKQALAPQLDAHQVRSVAENIEFPLIPVLVAMEQAGISVDLSLLDETRSVLADDIAGLEASVHAAAGEPFNLASTRELGTILFEKLGLRVVAKTGKGQPSTRESVLEELATEHEIPGMILDWRRLSKLKSTYVDGLTGLINPMTRRVHTSFNQTIAATGRLSSSNPNLQNIPVRTARGRELRKAFVPREGWTLMSADYVQIELRILASMAGDENLIAAFHRGEDIHTATAARVFGVALQDVHPDQRRKAKEVNYGIPYGVSAFGLAQRLRTSVSEAASIIDQYQRSYPAVAKWLAMQVERAREEGFVETLLGRRRYVPDIRASNRVVRGAAERIAVNMPIQGTQADMIKIAMINIHRALAEGGFDAQMVLQVHDELVLEMPLEEEAAVASLLRAGMIDALPLEVPVEVDLSTGSNWLEAH